MNFVKCSCDDFCKVQYIIVIESVTVISLTCCFSVPGYLYIHNVFVFKCAVLLLVLYTSQSLIRLIIPYMYQSFTNIIVHSFQTLKVQTVCSR